MSKNNFVTELKSIFKGQNFSVFYAKSHGQYNLNNNFPLK